MKKYVAEFIGTMVLVLFGTGVAVLSNGNLVATSIAFGLSIVAMAYAIGDISGCHINPAVSLAMFLTKKLDKKDFGYYVLAQVFGALAGTTLLFTILSATDFGTIAIGANGFADLSATNISMIGALITEIVLTFVFIYTILGVTSDEKYAKIAGLVIGFTLTFVHLLGIPLTGTSVNPARSLAPALFAGPESLKQVWLFIIAPLLGSALAAYTFKYLNQPETKKKK